MKAFSKLLFVVFLVSGFALAGCSEQEEVLPETALGTVEEAAPVDEADGLGDGGEEGVQGDSVSDVSTSSISDDVDAKRQEARERILKQRAEADAVSSPPELANTGVATNVAIAAAVFFALVYVGVRRKVLGKAGE